MSEIQEHIRLCNFIKCAYPDVLFTSDLSGLKLDKRTASLVKILRSGNGYPDLFVIHPNNKYHGLFIELKKSGETIYNKKNELKTDHLKEQNDKLEALRKLGFYATFAIGYNQAEQVVKDYMNNKL